MRSHTIASNVSLKNADRTAFETERKQKEQHGTLNGISLRCCHVYLPFSYASDFFLSLPLLIPFLLSSMSSFH